MVNTPGSSINEKNRRASGGLFLFPFSWAHLPSMDQTTVASIFLGSVGGSEVNLRALLMLTKFNNLLSKYLIIPGSFLTYWLIFFKFKYLLGYPK